MVFEFNLSQDKYEASWEYHGPVIAFNKQLAVAINENQLPDMVIIDNPDMRSYVKDCINWSQNDVARKFISGESAMMENGPWVLPAVIKSNINYGIVRLPVDIKSVSVAGGENIGVIKNKNIEGALTFIDFYNQDEVMLKICKMSNALPPKLKLASRLAEKNPEYKVFVEQMATCISRSSYDFWPEVTDDLSKGLFQVVTGEITPEEVGLNIRNNRLK